MHQYKFCLKHHTGHLDVSDYRLHQVDLISKEFPGRFRFGAIVRLLPSQAKNLIIFP